LAGLLSQCRNARDAEHLATLQIRQSLWPIRQELREIREIDDGQFSRIAQELCVTQADLEAMVRQGPHAADELPRLLKALGIDGTALSRTQSFMLRNMERVCTLCQQKPQCDHDLDASTSAHHYEEYCPNAPTIDALGHKPWFGHLFPEQGSSGYAPKVADTNLLFRHECHSACKIAPVSSGDRRPKLPP
jgi:hypothetical protein